MKYIKAYESKDYLSYIENMRVFRTEYLRKKKILDPDYIQKIIDNPHKKRKPDPIEIQELRNRFHEEKNKLRALVEKEFIDEFSKYLELAETNPDYLMFLLEPDYGIKINFEKNGLGNIKANIHTIFTDNRTKDKKFSRGGLREEYFAGQELSIKDLVSNYIIRLNKENEIRKRNKEKREFKKSLKKFNI